MSAEALALFLFSVAVGAAAFCAGWFVWCAEQDLKAYERAECERIAAQLNIWMAISGGELYTPEKVAEMRKRSRRK